ncbi:hypothetical protein JYU34_005527 [Plutella xylostella]|uniref:WD repeat protein mio zinc-ribbon like domain-containing protein n=1 Tax=Plutella xylostella TaxID=51655 RepID=A0ABQ7QTG2_PLUXY|nr:hypothetical protein JYU34_005527 [Plutella xylostella]
MISGAKYDVLWSPVHTDKFILWGSDITLYEVAPLKDIEKKSTCVKISPSSGATVLASQSAGGVRCVDFSWISGLADPLLALGHTNGQVSLTSLGQNTEQNDLVGKEFLPRYPRLCNSVSWSPTEPGLLAAALDKHRSDHCILLWDVHRGAPATAAGSESSSTPPEAARPLAEMGLSETAHSVSWTHASNRTLIASMNQRSIKIFDLRDLSNKAVTVATTRACYGAAADPLCPWQLASRGDSAVCVWDLRRPERALLTLPQPRPVAKILWCPTRRNLLLSLLRDSSSLRLHDIQQAHSAGRSGDDDEDELSSSPSAVEAVAPTSQTAAPGVVERALAPPAAQPLAGAAWHPAGPRVLAVALNGTLSECVVRERVVARFWPGGVAVGGAGGALRLHPAPRDPAAAMRRRAPQYGLQPELWQNAELAEDEALGTLWHFLSLSRSLVEDGCIRSTDNKHPGVLTVVAGEGGGYRSECVPSLFPDLPHRRVTIYRSAERTRALQLCGWGWGWEQAAAGVERAEAGGQPARAALLAAAHLRLRTALDVLGRASDPAVRVAALAFAGLGEERLWRETVSTAAAALPEPYLRALLHFLAATAPAAAAPAPPAAMDAVLNETEMRLEDRVAFACMYLCDTRLQQYLRGLGAALADPPALSGLLLTGMSPAGVSLIQRWVDATGDVQSAALLAARCLPPAARRADPARHWLAEYRSLLESWKLWYPRCALDTFARAGDDPAAPDQLGGKRQVCVACSYCGKSVAAPPAHARPRPSVARLPPPTANMKQISSCPHCRKPLPRCGVCSLHVGTAAGGAGGAGAHFAGWFTWCVACRHTGHATHLMEWFK